jgi:hypothetical protein
MGKVCSSNGNKRNVCRLLIRNPEGKRPLGSSRRRWVDNIVMYLGEIEWGVRDWISLAQFRNQWRAVASMVTNFQVAKNAGKFLSDCTNRGYWV